MWAGKALSPASCLSAHSSSAESPMGKGRRDWASRLALPPRLSHTGPRTPLLSCGCHSVPTLAQSGQTAAPVLTSGSLFLAGGFDHALLRALPVQLSKAGFTEC